MPHAASNGYPRKDLLASPCHRERSTSGLVLFM